MGVIMLGIILALAEGTPEETLPPAIQGHMEGDAAVPELLQVADSMSDTVGGKPCAARHAETQKLLQAYQAARLVHLDSAEYGVKDDTTAQLVHAWESQYKEAQAEYDFYCSQTEEDLHRIAVAVAKKEAVAVQNAAQAGLIAAQATLKHKRMMAKKAHDAAVERRQKDELSAKQRRKAAQEKTDKLADEAIQKNTERLRKLPQITRSLYGQVIDAKTGKPVGDAKVLSTCLFTVRHSTSRANGKFTVANGISGPSGRQCNVQVSKDGYVAATYPVTVMMGDTDAVYRQSMILPEIDDDKKFRFVLQYGASPPNLDAHVLVPMPDATYRDIAEAPIQDDTDTVHFGANGTAAELPYATLDHTATRFGPETASVHNVNDGVYHFIVVNSAQSFTTAEDFSQSQARAFLYQGNKLLTTVSIETAQGDPTQMWGVYTLDCLKGVCSLKITNKYLETSPVH